MIILLLVILVVAIFAYFFVGRAKPAKVIEWGINFSQKQAQALGLDWRETYLAILDDLGAKKIKISAHWDLLEKSSGVYDFSELDWQLNQLADRQGKAILVIGMKTPRWPECHMPDWAKSLSKENQQKVILQLLEKMVLRYRQHSAILAWQVENEPLFPFGECPWRDKKFLGKEVALVKSLDPSRPIIVSDSGETPLWWNIAGIAGVDMVGATMYRQVWFNSLHRQLSYPFPSVFYQRKAKLVEQIFGKKVICVELQAEPWGEKLIQYISVDEQIKIMSLEKFQSNLDYAESSGLDTFYLWGGEWWYFLKEKQGNDSFWQKAKTVFGQSSDLE